MCASPSRLSCQIGSDRESTECTVPALIQVPCATPVKERPSASLEGLQRNFTENSPRLLGV